MKCGEEGGGKKKRSVQFGDGCKGKGGGKNKPVRQRPEGFARREEKRGCSGSSRRWGGWGTNGKQKWGKQTLTHQSKATACLETMRGNGGTGKRFSNSGGPLLRLMRERKSKPLASRITTPDSCLRKGSQTGLLCKTEKSFKNGAWGEKAKQKTYKGGGLGGVMGKQNYKGRGGHALVGANYVVKVKKIG